MAGTNPNVIFHLAAQVDLRASVSDPRFDARSNVLGTINLCEASRQAGVQRIVYAASGGSRYGAPACLPVNESSRVDPLSPYAVAKLAGELYLRAYAEMYGMAPICLALANVYGPRQNPHGEAGVIAVFASAMITGRPFTVYGDGTAARDYVYVDDVVDAFVRAGRAPQRRYRHLQHRHGTADHGYRGAPSDFCGPRRVVAALLRRRPHRRVARHRAGCHQSREGARVETRRRPRRGNPAHDPVVTRHLEPEPPHSSMRDLEHRCFA